MREIDPQLLMQAKENFYVRGESISQWAKSNNFSLQLVYRVLNGTCKANRGESHKIAVTLGLKPKVDG